MPAHVACSRHCSPEKLQMLLNINLHSLVAETNDGNTLLSLATGTATKSHPNYALIDALRQKMDEQGLRQQDISVNSTTSQRDGMITSKRKVTDEMDDESAVDLLLHFSKHADETPTQMEEV